MTAKCITCAQLVHLVHRVLILLAAMYYVVLSIISVVKSTFVLQGITSSLTTYSTTEATLIPHYVEKATIRDSELLKVLGDVTTPRNDSLYLESLTQTSFSGCSTPHFNAQLYSNMFMRTSYTGIQYGAYNLTFLANHELIFPVIDCRFPLVVSADASSSRVYYPTRLKTDPEDLYIMIVSISTQNYAVADQHQKEAASLDTYSLINDVRVASVKHHFGLSLGYPYSSTPVFEVYQFLKEDSDGKWVLRSIPPNPKLEAPKDVATTKRQGFFIKSENEQANFRNLHWRIFENDPVKAMSVWEWQGRTAVQDSWAWVHYIHIVFGLNTAFHHCVLFLTIYQNARLVNEYWAILELCFARGYEMAGAKAISIHPDIVYADLLTLFLGSVAILGFVTKERVDLAFAVAVFEITRHCDLDMSLLDNTTRQYLIDYSIADFSQGMANISDLLASMSPLRLWDSIDSPT